MALLSVLAPAFTLFVTVIYLHTASFPLYILRTMAISSEQDRVQHLARHKFGMLPLFIYQYNTGAKQKFWSFCETKDMYVTQQNPDPNPSQDSPAR